MKRARTIGLVMLALLAAGCPAAAQTVKFGSLAPEGSPWHIAFRDMAEAWKTASGGRVRMRIYPGGVAGDESDMVRKMRIGQLDAAALTAAGLSDIIPEIRILQMPMMLRSDGELDHIMRKMGPLLAAKLNDRGFKVLSWGDVGWLHFFAQRPVVSPEDLKPLRIFVWQGDNAYIAAWKAAGFKPVPMSATEIHVGLQSGLINALAIPTVAALSFQWFGAARHMLDMRWAPLVGATVVTRRKWRRLPADVRPRLLRLAEQAGDRLRKAVRSFDQKAVEVMKEHGLVVHAAPPDAVARWESAVRAVYPEIIGPTVSPGLVAEIERLRDAYRAGRTSD